ncbi:MAG: hypothetical protein H6671_12625 [Anaerolineaceae bacterium]|nr:hypothetical protein [Anaerolineaceae bacterium]
MSAHINTDLVGSALRMALTQYQGNCRVPMERFFTTLKTKLNHHCVFLAGDQARADIFINIKTFDFKLLYNPD